MGPFHILCLVGAVALGAWTVRLRRGQSAAARAWAREPRGSMDQLAPLVVLPMVTVALLAAAASGLTPDGSTAERLVMLLLLAALVVGIAYAMLPIPVPRFTTPRWYRDQRPPRARQGTR